MESTIETLQHTVALDRCVCIRLFKAGAYSRAVEVFRDVAAAGLEPNRVTYCQLISGLLKCRRRGSPNSQLAYQLWQELLSKEGLDGEAYKTGQPLSSAYLVLC